MATIGATYHEHMARALPGQWGDTSAYNIDGACVLDGNKNVLVGTAVAVKSVESFQGHKLIEPMAASVAPTRYADPAKVEKWFKRNCTEVLGRECTPLEKGDWLAYMAQQ